MDQTRRGGGRGYFCWVMSYERTTNKKWSYSWQGSFLDLPSLDTLAESSCKIICAPLYESLTPIPAHQHETPIDVERSRQARRHVLYAAFNQDFLDFLILSRDWTCGTAFWYWTQREIRQKGSNFLLLIIILQGEGISTYQESINDR